MHREIVLHYLFLTLLTLGLSACGTEVSDPDEGDDQSRPDHEGEKNLCGGFLELAFEGRLAEPLEPCGECDDGIIICLGEENLECVRAGSANACGGCSDQPAPLGESCGLCDEGIYLCNESAEVICGDQVGRNACGGCSALEGHPFHLCEVDGQQGVWSCLSTEAVACMTLGTNPCGGTTPIPDVLGASCGTCNLGVVVCDGTDNIMCQELDEPLNLCGGCMPLAGTPGESCGDCGSWRCDGTEWVLCEEERNACGGCAILDEPPGASCEDGTWSCEGLDAIACDPDALNDCGGRSPLETPPGEPCGECGDGFTVCATPDATACAGGTDWNICGGCGILPADPGSDCGPGLVWECTVEGTMECVEEKGLNACGGLTDLDTEPGEPCGACGWSVCEGEDAVICIEGSILNACGGCGTLDPQPGDPCGACGDETYQCTGPDSVACSGEGEMNLCGGCETLLHLPGDPCGSCDGTYQCDGADAVLCIEPSSCEDASTKGTEFWVAFMENLSLVSNGPPQFSMVIATGESTTGEIVAPQTGLSIPFDIEGADVVEIMLPEALYYIDGSDVIGDVGLRVTSDVPIDLFAVHYRLYFSDATRVLPIDELGNRYLVLAAEDVGGYSPSEFVVAATEDDTEIEITPSTLTLALRPEGLPYTVTLDAGQIYQVQAAFDLTGSEVIAPGGQPIAVFSGARQASIVCSPDSHVYDQLLPERRWGTEHVVIPFIDQGGDPIVILAGTDGTEVRIDCGEPVYLDRGDRYDMIKDWPTRITSNYPVQVAQFNKSQGCNDSNLGDPSFLVVPPAALTRTDVSFESLANYHIFDTSPEPFHGVNFWMMGAGFVTIDGVEFEITYSISDTPWTVASMALDSNAHTLSSELEIGGVAYGFSSYDAYTFHLGWDCEGCVPDLSAPMLCP